MAVQENVISGDSVLTVRDAFKTYDGSEYILKGLNMNVKQSEIYCLLGASGCGKSTLLNLIVGLLDLDSGIIKTTVKSRQDLGYMTQETSLYEQLNIYETFFYYGTIYGLSKKQIQTEMNMFYTLLDLPDRQLNIQFLSGGQKRRVSLAMALLHKPELLILDEPTVGLDSLLRDSTWEYLIRLSNDEKKTIIITTHYIEEGKQAHTVGFMRHGIIVCEESPQYLSEVYNTNSLEDVFLEISKQQVELDVQKNYSKTDKKNPYSLQLKATNNLNKHKILGEINKNLIFLKRNISVTIFTMMLPAFCVSIFSFTSGRSPEGLKFGMIMNESPSGLSFCKNVLRTENCSMEYLSCIYSDMLRNKKLNLKEYNDINQAIEDVKTNKIWGVIGFPQNYSNAVYTLIDNINTNDPSVFDNRAYVYMDYSNMVIKDILLRDIRDSYFDMLKQVYKNCSWSTEAANIAIKFEEPIYGDAIPNFRLYFCAPVVTMTLLTTPLMYGLTIMIEEKRGGATARSIIAGVNVYEVMISHFIVQFFLQIILTTMVISTTYGILQFPFNQPYLTTMLLFMQSLTGISLAFTLATLTDSINVTSGFQTGLTIVSMMVGGMMWPLEAEPAVIRYFSCLLPSTLPTEAVRSLTIRNKGLSDEVVYKGFMSSIIWCSALTLSTYLIVKKTKGKSFIKM